MARLVLRFVGVDPDADLAMFAPLDGEIPLLRLKVSPEKDGKPVAFGTLVDVTYVRSSNRVVRYSWVKETMGDIKIVSGEVQSIRTGTDVVILEFQDGTKASSRYPASASPNDFVRFRVQGPGTWFYDLEVLDEDGDPKEDPKLKLESAPKGKQAAPPPRGTLFDSMASLLPPVEDHGDRLTILPKASVRPDFGDSFAMKAKPTDGDYDYLLEGEEQQADELDLGPPSPPAGASATRPAYYRVGSAYEPRKVIKAWGLGFNLGMVLKYICRHGKKPGATAKLDLQKCIEYLQFELEEMEGGPK